MKNKSKLISGGARALKPGENEPDAKRKTKKMMTLGIRGPQNICGKKLVVNIFPKN